MLRGGEGVVKVIQRSIQLRAADAVELDALVLRPAVKTAGVRSAVVIVLVNPAPNDMFLV